MEANQIQEIQRLRGLKLSPKEIARSLKLRPAEVNAILRQQATTLEQARVASGELDPLFSCLVNESGVALLKPGGSKKTKGTSGFVQVWIARTKRLQLSICSFLVDPWCLGVKDAFGPRAINKAEFTAMIQSASDNLNEDFIETPLEQAQAIVFGAVDYAAKLGISPHADFEAAKQYLGVRPEVLLPIEFGKDGKPFYINGPFDNPEIIIAKLEKSVGSGNYDYMIGHGDMDD